MTPLMFLLKLAWDCRYRLPLIIIVGFLALDIRMQLEVNVTMRGNRRDRNMLNPDENPDQNDDSSDSELESNSWLTEEEFTLSSSGDEFEAYPGTSRTEATVQISQKKSCIQEKTKTDLSSDDDGENRTEVTNLSCRKEKNYNESA